MFLKTQPSSVCRDPRDKDTPFVIIGKELLYNKEVSPKARFILIFMLSKPDNWQFYQKQLSGEIGISEEGLVSGLEELIKHGYIQRTREKTSGQFMPYSYKISEFKRYLPVRDLRTGVSGPEKPDILNKDITGKGCKSLLKKEDIPIPHPSSSTQKNIPSFDPATFDLKTYVLPNGKKLTARCVAQFKKYKSEELPKLYAAIEYMELQYSKKPQNNPEIYLQKCINQGYAQSQMDRENNKIYAQIIKSETEIPFVIMKTVVKFSDGESISLDLNPITFGQILQNKKRNYNSI